tara:strand:- start:138 stop:899 length:762 start_codon:yes stop_codon:yes gene_type:complete
MKNTRLIARLDIKAPFLVKGIQLEGLRKLGDPNDFALKYYHAGIDEIFYIDIVASLYDRNSLTDIISKTTNEIFVPITVGGGIRSLYDVEKALRAGADKVAINTAAIKNPILIEEIAKRFGSSCVVLSIEAKKTNKDNWEAYYDNGREHSSLDVVEWAMEGQDRGAGEILITSVDRDGTKKGFDVDLVENISDKVKVPLIISGGFGNLKHISELISKSNLEGIAIGSSLHYEDITVNEIRQYCIEKQLPVRKF